MDNTNEMMLEFDSDSKNESFARVVVASFVSPLDPTMEEIADIKTAVSEAVTNSIIHGYESKAGKIQIRCKIEERTIYIEVIDKGVGIEDVVLAKQSLYTSKPELERSGLGFAFMEAFTDKLEVISSPEEGTTVRMEKTIAH